MITEFFVPRQSEMKHTELAYIILIQVIYAFFTPKIISESCDE
jgi:hypothetical protein